MTEFQGSVEKARLADVPQIQKLVQFYAERDEMLPRPLSEIYEHLRDFFVVRDEAGNVCGSVALHVLWSDIAEIKAMAVREDRRGQGIGRILGEACLAEAREIGLIRVFAFTYKPAFFFKLGFYRVEPMMLPRKVWGECFRCPKFGNCDEIAVVRDLGPTGEASLSDLAAGEQLPVLSSWAPTFRAR